jgi:myosin heavy subunit
MSFLRRILCLNDGSNAIIEENKALQQELKAKTQNEEKLKQEINELESKIASHEQELEKNRQEIKTLKQDKIELESKKTQNEEKLKQEINELESKIASHEQELEKNRQEIKTLKQDKIELNSKKTTQEEILEQNIKLLEAKLKSYEQDLIDCQKQVDSYKTLHKISIKDKDQWNKEKETILKEKKELEEKIEDQSKIIGQKSQELINLRAERNTNIRVRRIDEDGAITPWSVQEEFEQLLNTLAELQRKISDYINKEETDIEIKKKNCYKILIENCFEPNIWKTVTNQMKKNKLSNIQVSRVLSGKSKEEKGFDYNAILRMLKPIIEQKIMKELLKLVVEEALSNESIKTVIEEIAEKALLLASNIIVVEPRMAIVSAKKGDPFNPEKHEDITAEYKFVVVSLKRPGLICTVDNNVLVKASVETKLEEY